MQAIIVVPIRSGDPDRDRLWAYVRSWWTEHFDWPIFEGEHPHGEGPFNRALALNRGARAGLAAHPDADIIVAIDGDTIPDRDAVLAAVQQAHAIGMMALAYDVRVALDRPSTDLILAGQAPADWSGLPGKRSEEFVSCCVVVPRGLWDEMDGYDEKFSGYGYEDWAFCIAAETYSGKQVVRVPAPLYHLHHQPSPESSPRSPLLALNRKRFLAYRTLEGQRDALDEFLHLDPHGGPDAMIPPIFHRTVPSKTEAKVEAFWRTFQQHHDPAVWEFVTWRDPLDPAEWPLTAKAWDKCANGAQYAGLIRLEALYKHGGFYIDSDVECLRSWETLRFAPAVAGWEDNAVIPDAVLGAIPGHPAVLDMLAAAVESVTNGEDAWHSGPGVSTRILRGRDDVLLLPPGAFYPVHYHEKARLRENFSRTAPSAFSVHHWHGSWLTPEQRQRIAGSQRV